MLFTGMVAMIVGWRGNRAVSFAPCKCFVRLILAWDRYSHSPLHSFVLHQCSQLTVMQTMVLIICIHQRPSPKMQGDCASLVGKSNINCKLGTLTLVMLFQDTLANVISPYSAPGTLCVYLYAIRDLLPISIALLQGLCLLSCSLAFNWL